MRGRGLESLAALSLVVAAVQCGRHAAPGAAAEEAPAAVAAVGPMDAREADAWRRAKDGDETDGMRLAEQVGCDVLRARADDAALRPTALRTMGFCRDFSELPWLADVASSGTDADAVLALDAIVQQAARERRPVDPEDASELGEGCRSLLVLARAAGQPRPRRMRAVRALRMLADRGCVKRADIPPDLDVK